MSDLSRPLPSLLRELSVKWEAAGCPQQPATHWTLVPWLSALPEQGDLFASLPNPISRPDVVEACREADRDPEEAVRGFVAAMVWGYGRVGYGPYRTARVLNENAGAAETLADAARIARLQGGPDAFEWFSQHRLRGLGVAFATKYLFFCAANGNADPAPVLDRLVRGWLARNADMDLSLDWRVKDYRCYVANLAAWGAEVGHDPADMEYLIFADEVSADSTSRWSQGDFPGVGERGTRLVAPLTPEESAVLEALDDAADAYAALPGSTTAGDSDDFDRAMRQLRRIVLARRRS